MPRVSARAAARPEEPLTFPAAALFALLMAASRADLGAHWLSDAVAGLLRAGRR
jgi:membrane-associated phospholipid phosphatase